MRKLSCTPDDAFGSLLAAPVSRAGCRLAKGKIIGADEINQLNAAGVATVKVLRVGIGDLLANAVANRILNRLRGAGTQFIPAIGGRGQIRARRNGIVDYAQKQLGKANQSNLSLRVSATAPLTPVAAKSLCATARAKEPVFIADDANAYCALVPPINLYPFYTRSAVLVHVLAKHKSDSERAQRYALINQELSATGNALTQIISCTTLDTRLTDAMAQAMTASLVVFLVDEARKQHYVALRTNLDRLNAQVATLQPPGSAQPWLGCKTGNTTVLVVPDAHPNISKTTSLLLKIAATDLGITPALFKRIDADQ